MKRVTLTNCQQFRQLSCSTSFPGEVGYGAFVSFDAESSEHTHTQSVGAGATLRRRRAELPRSQATVREHAGLSPRHIGGFANRPTRTPARCRSARLDGAVRGSTAELSAGEPSPPRSVARASLMISDRVLNSYDSIWEESPPNTSPTTRPTTSCTSSGRTCTEYHVACPRQPVVATLRYPTTPSLSAGHRCSGAGHRRK